MAISPPKPGAGARVSQVGADLQRRAAADRQDGRHASDELAEQCRQVEDALEELKAKYELYFLGVERLEPAKRRGELKRSVLRLKSAFTRNTGLRFRIESLHARYLSYERLWTRAAREKEEGTYRRDIFKARLRHAPAPPPGKQGEKGRGAPEDVDLSDWHEAPAAATPAPTARAAAADPAGPGGVIAEGKMRTLYDTYLEAKKRCNEDVSGLTYEAVARSVAKQVPGLLARYKAQAVDFKVVIKDGRAILKAVPKKS